MSTALSQRARAAGPDIHRTRPHSEEAEQGVLGAMLISPSEVCPLAENLQEVHWYIPTHWTIFQILITAWRTDRPMDVITLTQALRDANELEAVGGPAFITHLFTFTPTAAAASYYLEIVREKAALRVGVDETGGNLDLLDVIKTASDLSVVATAAEVADHLERTAQRVRDMMTDPNAAYTLGIKDDVSDSIGDIEKLYESRGRVMGAATGYKGLDNLTGGLQRSEMIVIAARPSQGKTALGINIAEHVAVNTHLPVAIFSLEMSRKQLVQRMLCSRARVNLQNARDGFPSERDFSSLIAAADKLAKAPIIIDDTSGLTISDLRAKARQMHRATQNQGGLALIVIDYLQLLRSTTRRAQDNRQLEIAEISGGIKALAKELNIPVIALAQTNRDVEKRRGKPRMSDLRESGAIEQDADVIAFIHHPASLADDTGEKEDLLGQAELLIEKQRNGPVGEVKLTFLKEFTRFEDRALKPR